MNRANMNSDKLILTAAVSAETISQLTQGGVIHRVRPSDGLQVGVAVKVTDHAEIVDQVQSHPLIKKGVFHFLPAVYFIQDGLITFKPLIPPACDGLYRERLVNILSDTPSRSQERLNYLDEARKFEMPELFSPARPSMTTILDTSYEHKMREGSRKSAPPIMPGWLLRELLEILPVSTIIGGRNRGYTGFAVAEGRRGPIKGGGTSQTEKE